MGYVERLNRGRFGGGRDNWRLPTVEELMSILSPAPRGTDFCMAPVFDQRQKWLWSCDKRSFLAGWYVNVELGFVSWQDFSCFYYVKAVSDREPLSIHKWPFCPISASIGAVACAA